MKLFHTVRIKQHERGLWFRHGEFQQLLGPGAYRVWFWNRRRDRVDVVSTLNTKFEHPLIDVLLARFDVRDALVVVDNADHERALVWRDGRLAYVLGPGRFALWAVPYRLHVERFDVNAFALAHPRVQAVLAHPDAPRWLDGVAVGTMRFWFCSRMKRMRASIGVSLITFSLTVATRWPKSMTSCSSTTTRSPGCRPPS